MATGNQDEAISRFLAVTQCSSSRDAREYLESAKWNEQAAIDFYFDSINPQEPEPAFAPPPPPPSSTRVKPNPGKSESTHYESDDDLLQTALEASLRLNVPKQESPVMPPRRADPTKSIVSSRINTMDKFRKAKDDEDENSDDEDEGQAFYAGGSERSGQQIIGPPKSREPEKNVAKIFEAARKQGASEAPPTDASSKQEKSFAGVGYSLADEQPPSRSQGQPAAAVPTVQELPIRFYSNGFTVGEGELRKFEENREFVECIKRGEVPPELRNMNTNGRQVEVRLEDHHQEEYKHVAPAFQAFTGTGHTVGLPRSSAVPRHSSIATPVHTSAPDATRLEQLAERRLKTSSTSTTIRLRLPEMSTPVSVQIDLNRTLNDVRRFLTENVPVLQTGAFDFLEPPATKIKREDERKKIGDGHLANSTLAVQRTA